MTPHPAHAPGAAGASGHHFIGTVAAAKHWLTQLAQAADATLTIPEPLPSLGGGLVLLAASLRRADGTQANFQISCLDDDETRGGQAGMLPAMFPSVTARVGWN